MNECPYCYARVGPDDSVCPNCGRQIDRWQTGFYTRQKLPTKSRTAVWAGVVIVVILILVGFARACSWI